VRRLIGGKLILIAMTGPFSLVSLVSILSADFVRPIRAEGVNDDQFFCPAKAF
jgi:hypothetical protein